jgi:hypothetical protein
MNAALDEVDKRLSVHEAVCAERYANLMSRLSRIERVFLSVAGTLLVGMGGLTLKLILVLARIQGGS